MSQQLQITGGAKVRSLEGVITGSTGVLGSLPINGSNGIPQLDSNGKILVSQLPNSVMEYLGTWNAATNTPTLANGTGNAGDVYLCNVAGTVDFGAGPITFYVGDQVIYSGTIWQRASGATGSVTSVAVTETGDALTITGSPITTSGTINIGFAGSSTQYIAGDGTLVTFPTIVTEAQNLITDVYNETGATLTKGTVVYINGGHGNLPTVTKALATSDATSAQTYGVVQTDIGNNNNGHVVVIGRLENLNTQAYSNGTQLYLSSTTAGAWTSTKQYAPAHLVYVGIVTRSHPTQGVVEIKIQNGYELDELHNVSAQTPSNNDGIFYNTSTSLWENKSIATALGYTPANAADLSNYVTLATSQVITGAKIFDGGVAFSSIGGLLGIEGGASVYKGLALAKGYPPSTFITGFSTLYSESGNNNAVFNDNSNTSKLQFQATSSYTYTFPANTGTLALTSDIPSVTNFVTLNTLQTIIGTKIYSSLQYFDNNVYIKHGISGSSSGYTTLGASASGLNINLASGTSNNSFNFASTSAGNTYTFPNATGTVALTSDLAGYLPLTGGTLTGALTGTNASFNYVSFNNTATAPPTITGFSSLTFIDNGSLLAMNIKRSDGQRTTINLPDDGFTHQYDFPSTDGTIALTSNLSSYVPTSRTLTINGTTYDLSADRSWTVSGSQWTTSGSDIYYNTGNVGIGLTNPAFPLEVSSTSTTLLARFTSNQANAAIRIVNSSSSGGRTYSIGSGDTTSAAGNNFYIYDETNGALRFAINNSGNITVNGTLTADGVSIGASDVRSTSGTLTLGGTSEAVRIVSSGNVGIGTTNPTYKLYVNGTAYATGAAGALSDIRHKNNIENINNGLDLLINLRPVSYLWNKDLITDNGMNGIHFGFIAQEVKEILPNIILEQQNNEKTLGLKYMELIPLLVKAIQELKLEIDELKNK